LVPFVLRLHELLAAIDVIGRPGQDGVRHEVHGQGGEVRGPDDTADRAAWREALRGAPRSAADYDDGLPEQFGLALGWGVNVAFVISAAFVSSP
jgi:hypothetical protein